MIVKNRLNHFVSESITAQTSRRGSPFYARECWVDYRSTHSPERIFRSACVKGLVKGQAVDLKRR